ncbi:hypothetical protein HU200_030546 [Digitaria exilis]|uniref:DUF7866 domain-containing protein n=1 Tax=Digitaria exilis TaxID=1010633 RepID=A0A835BRB3_9POAL|nr:hypothetical protein HU200_030546 [Digitaria exilis]
MANPPKPMICLTLLVLLFTPLQVQGQEERAGGEQKRDMSRRPEEYVPVQSVAYLRRLVWAAEETPLLVCGGGCRCCAASNSSKCVDDTPCCFGINCNLPGKPYGTCAFQSLTCGCGSCPTSPWLHHLPHRPVGRPPLHLSTATSRYAASIISYSWLSFHRIILMIQFCSDPPLFGKHKQAAAGASSNLGRSGEQKRQPEYVPVRSVVYRSLALPAAVTTTTTEAVGGYEPFEVCEGCRCCSTSNASSCVDTSCCYSIDCNLPGKPYGTCAFTPQTCGCGSTSNCTQPS